MSVSQSIKSPCLRVCAVDGRANACRGCGRSLKEIANWGAMSEAERDDVLQLLPARIEALGERASNRDEALTKIADLLGDRAH
ncbi:DUF1289 domain-containing protein [Parvibaculum sp.]|uniref:DUF1289 domain-containing protein n=1 Tax=Parvibaculum sp. TaxID=2024848 RepID=UPI003919F743